MVSRSKILCVVSQEAIQVVPFQQSSDVHKKCKIQVSTIYPNATLCIKRCTPFIEIDDKGERLVQRYYRKLDLDMDMDKEGVTLKKRDGSKFLDKRSTQVGGASS